MTCKKNDHSPLVFKFFKRPIFKLGLFTIISVSVFFIVGIVTFSNPVLAEEDADIDKEVQTTSSDKMTIREAKGLCKAEGKKGKELIICIKEKIKK